MKNISFFGRVNRADENFKYVTLTGRPSGFRFEAQCSLGAINAEVGDEFEVLISEDGSRVRINKLEPKTLSDQEIEKISKEVDLALGNSG